MSQATIPVTRKAFEKLNKIRLEESGKLGKRITWSDFLLNRKISYGK